MAYLLLIGYICALGMNLAIGSQFITLLDVYSCIRDHLWSDPKWLILTEIRLPRAIVASLSGFVLASSGAVSQTLFQNTLASPSIIGTTAGGTLFAMAVFYIFGGAISWWEIPLAASVGSLLTTLFIFIISLRNDFGTEKLLLVGLAITTVSGALTSLFLSLLMENYQEAVVALNWTFGGFSLVSWQEVFMISIPFFLVLPFVMGLTIPLNQLMFGMEFIKTIGISPKWLQARSIAVISIWSGAAIAVGGQIPFMGLIVPHFARLLHGSDMRKLIPYAGGYGAILCLVCDLLARMLRSPLEIQIGILTSIIGTPFFIWMIYRTKSRGM